MPNDALSEHLDSDAGALMLYAEESDDGRFFSPSDPEYERIKRVCAALSPTPAAAGVGQGHHKVKGHKPKKIRRVNFYGDRGRRSTKMKTINRDYKHLADGERRCPIGTGIIIGIIGGGALWAVIIYAVRYMLGVWP